MHVYLLISLFIFLIGAFGIFGNVNIIIAIYRLKPQVKSSILVGLLAFADLFCILSEWQNAFRNLFNVQSYRRECFWWISPYLIMTQMESFLLVALAFDRFFAFTFPFKYIAIRTSKYIFLCCIPGLITTAVIITLGIRSLDNEPIGACNPPLAYTPSISKIWNDLGVLTSLLTLTLFVAALVCLCVKRWKYRHATHAQYHILETQKKLSFSCIVMILVYLCTGFSIQIALTISSRLNLSKNTFEFIQTTMVIPAMLAYSQSYYVYFACSGLYREAFKMQLAAIMPNNLKKHIFARKSATVSVASAQLEFNKVNRGYK